MERWRVVDAELSTVLGEPRFAHITQSLEYHIRRSLLGIALLSLFATAALSNEPSQIRDDEPSEAHTVRLPTKRLPGLATLITPREAVSSGDMIAINRPFENWVLMCDYRLSQNKRICVIEQVVGNETTHVRWRVATTVDRKPLLVISIPTHIILSSGLRLGFAELEKTIPEAEWFCTAETCITGFPFEGFLQAAIQSSQEVSFSFSVRTSDDAETPIRLAGSMQGFADAVKAATTDPFGKDIVESALIANKTVQEPAKSANKPTTQPKGSKNDRAQKLSAQEAKNTRKPPAGLY